LIAFGILSKILPLIAFGRVVRIKGESEMMLTDHVLSQRLEAFEAHFAREYAMTHARLFPAARAAYATIADGTAVFAGADSPLTQAVGLGMNGVVDEEEVDRLEDFYRQHGALVNVEFCPHADDSLRQAFARRGYTLIEQGNVLVQELPARHALAQRADEVRVRQAEPGELDELARVVTRGFIPEGAPSPPELTAVFTVFCHMLMVTAFVAEIDGRMIGGGGAAVRDDVVSLFATSTVSEARGRGAQSALIQARLSFGATMNCELATVGALPGSTSHRNLERCGFRVAYTRAKLFRKL
jgi:GNAT superfamily N-acetyltransferase